MSFGAAGVQWRQPEGADNVLEIDLPIVLPAGGRARDLSVTIADKQIIVVKHQDVKLWQVRLAEPVSDTVEWHVENEHILKMELEKVVPNRWSSLLAHFMAKTDPNFLSLDELNAILRKELPSLPPIGAAAKKEEETPAADAEATPEEADATVAEDGEKEEAKKEDTEEEAKDEAAAETEDKEEETKEDGEEADAPAAAPAADSEDDLDKLLDDAADELDGSKPVAETPTTVDGEKAEAETKKDEEKKHHDLIIEAELDAMKQESDAIVSKMEELEEKLKTAEGEELEMVKKHLEVTGRMLALNREARQLRVEPMTVDLFLQTQRIDILKARCNIGDTTNEETEEFADETEKGMSGEQLFQAGMQFLETDPETGVHFLRLASIHKDHAVATSILFSIYSNAPASYARGVSLVMRLARIGETADDIVASANDRAGSLFNAGARHFAPLWAVAVYFHQRGALTGSIQSMLALSNLHRKGVCEGAEGTPDELLTKNNKKGEYFSRQALDRGGIMAYAQLASKELGANNLVDARKHLDRAIAADPEIRKSETIAKLDLIIRMKSKQEEAPAASIAPSKATTMVKPAADDDDDVEEMHPSSRLQPAPTMPSAADRLAQFGGGNAAPSAAGAAPRGGASGIMGTTKGRGGATSGSGAKSKAFWERATTVSIVGGALYFFAFPIRAMMLESYYNFVGGLLAAIGFGDSSAPF